MSHSELEAAIESAWESRETVSPETGGAVREAIETALHSLDSGQLRVAERGSDGVWRVNQWAKKAVMLGFRIRDMEPQSGGPQESGWWDKVDNKFVGWTAADWHKSRIPGRAELHRPPVGLCRPRRHSDAMLS